MGEQSRLSTWPDVNVLTAEIALMQGSWIQHDRES
jgi:hypothetical protein